MVKYRVSSMSTASILSVPDYYPPLLAVSSIVSSFIVCSIVFLVPLVSPVVVLAVSKALSSMSPSELIKLAKPYIICYFYRVMDTMHNK